MKRLLKKLIITLIPFGHGYKLFVTSTILPNAYTGYLKFRLGINKIYWPRDKTCLISHPRKIYVGMNSWIGRPGSYIQGAGGVYIGNYVRFGPNVGILSSNHDLYDKTKYNNKPIYIGDSCWIGMNSTVLAGVKLGPGIIVGANSVVTKSFPDGYCVIAGNPARIVKKLEKSKVVLKHNQTEYYGYIPKEKFERIKHKYLDI